jgi:hypothetical protein
MASAQVSRRGQDSGRQLGDHVGTEDDQDTSSKASHSGPEKSGGDRVRPSRIRRGASSSIERPSAAVWALSGRAGRGALPKAGLVTQHIRHRDCAVNETAWTWQLGLLCSGLQVRKQGDSRALKPASRLWPAGARRRPAGESGESWSIFVGADGEDGE